MTNHLTDDKSCGLIWAKMVIKRIFQSTLFDFNKTTISKNLILFKNFDISFRHKQVSEQGKWKWSIQRTG